MRSAPSFADHANDLGQHRIGPDALSPNDQSAGTIDGAADHPVAGFFSTGIGSPLIIDSSTDDLPSDTLPSTGYLFAWTNSQPIAGNDLLDRNLFVVTIVAYAPGGLGSEAEQGADRAAGLAPCPQFENLAQEHKGHDHRRTARNKPEPHHERRGTNQGKCPEKARRLH